MDHSETKQNPAAKGVRITQGELELLAGLSGKVAAHLAQSAQPAPDALPTVEEYAEICDCGGEDGEVDYWGWVHKNGLMDGSCPDKCPTREELAISLYRLHAMITSGAIPAAPVAEGLEPLPYTDEELDILYRIAWAEARGEDDKGIILVINVILNRVNSPVFPNQNTIREVVFAPNQFEPIRNGMFDRATPDQRIKDLVHQALRGTDFSRGALFFNAVRLRETSWAGQNRTHAFDHGGHSFYY